MLVEDWVSVRNNFLKLMTVIKAGSQPELSVKISDFWFWRILYAVFIKRKYENIKV